MNDTTGENPVYAVFALISLIGLVGILSFATYPEEEPKQIIAVTCKGELDNHSKLIMVDDKVCKVVE